MIDPDEEKTVDTTQQLTFGPLPPAELSEQAFLLPRLMPHGEPSSNSIKLIDHMKATPLSLTSEELIQKQINAYFTKQFSNPNFNVRNTSFQADFNSFCRESTQSRYIGQLGENSPRIKNLMVSRQQSVSMSESGVLGPSTEQAVSISGSSLATKLAEMYPNKVEIGPEAVARRKKPNIDIDEKDLQEMFAEWLREKGINPEDLAKKRQTLICDTDREMDVIKVEGIPTMNGIKNLELLVPQKKLTGLDNLDSKNINKTNDPASNERFAENYIRMLGLKAEMEVEGRSIEMHNRLSSILFRCLLSLVLGYLYNNGLDMLRGAIFTGVVAEEEANDIAFQFTQERVDYGIIQEGNYTAIGEQYDIFYSLLVKENVVNPDFKNILLPDEPDAPLEQSFETLLEMIVRIANMEPGTKETPYLKILQSVCFSITLILNKYELITTAAGELVGPYWESVVYLAANDSTIMQRLQSIVILAVAYNSYGWLFTVMAPLAIPSVVSVGSWALCSLARLPFGIIKFTGKGLLSVGKFFVGYQEDPNIMPIEAGSENTLIQVGWIKKQVGGDIKLIPHMVSKGDVQRLSQYIANHEIQKPSLLSSIFDAHGVADLNMQSPHGVEEWSFYLRQTNPIGRLLCCITEEFAELTVVDINEEVGYVKTLEERMFTLFFRTIRDENVDNGFTLQPLVEMWTETLFTKLYETKDALINGVNTAIDTTNVTFATSNFKDTLLEAIVIMLSSRYVDTTIRLGPNLSRQNSSTSTMSDITINSKGSDAYSYKTTNGENVVISVTTTPIGSDRIGILLDVDVPIIDQPPLSRMSSMGSDDGSQPPLSPVPSASSTVSTLSLSNFSRNTDSPNIIISTQLSLPTDASSSAPSRILYPENDPSVLFKQQQHAKIIEQIEEIIRKKITENEQLPSQETDSTSSSMSASNIRPSNLSGFIVADAVGSIMTGLFNLSDKVFAPNGGYRRRSGPILATIGRKIINNGIYRAIKPKLIASVYGKSKGRQRKRYTKKHGIKKVRKQTTKKIRRKRRSTHKKYKRR